VRLEKKISDEIYEVTHLSSEHHWVYGCNFQKNVLAEANVYAALR
jgi:hypothetical protein